jgi:hypothetical protein
VGPIIYDGKYSGQVIFDKFQIKAHDVRALASSRALFNNASLNEVLSAGFWRGESSQRDQRHPS